MHQAFYPIRLIKNNHYEFESLSCYQNYLLLGTKSGLLLIYQVVPTTTNHPAAFIPSLEQDIGNPETSHPPRQLTTPNISAILNGNEEVPSTPLPSFNVRVCATHNLNKKRIMQLQAVPEYGFFLALTELQLAAYRISDRQLVAVVPNSKGASQFAVMYQSTSASRPPGTPTLGGGPSRVSNMTTQQGFYTEEFVVPDTRNLATGRQLQQLPLNLCVCVKRRIHFFRWSPAHQSFVAPNAVVPEDPVIAAWPAEFTLQEPARWAQFCGTENLIIGLHSDYLRLNLRSRELVTIATPNKLSPTLATPLPYCLDAVNFNTRQNTTAVPSLESLVAPNEEAVNCSWTLGATAPFALASDESTFTLLPNASDTVPNSEGKDVVTRWSSIVQCLQVYPPYILGGLTKRLEVRSLNPCSLVQAFGIPSVRGMCFNNTGWLYAIAAASVYPDDSAPDLSCVDDYSPSLKTVTTGHGSDVWLLLSANRMNLIRDLAQKKEFEMALKLARFTQLSAQPAVETHCLAALHAFHMFDTQRKFEEALQLFYRLNTDPTQVLTLCPDLLPKTYSEKFTPPSDPKPLSQSEKAALAEPLITYLLCWRNRLRGSQHQADSSLQSSPRGQATAKTTTGPEKDSSEQLITCVPMVMGSTDEASCRHSIVKLLQIVDTCLLRCYLLTNVARIGPLLRQENYCQLEEVECILKENNCLDELMMVYRMRGLHREALQVLSKLTSGKSPSPSDSMEGTQARDYRAILNYLKSLENTPVGLVFEFADWIYKEHARAWISIFTAWEQRLRRGARDSKNADNPFSYRLKVLRHLEKKASHLTVPFLERLIFSFDECDEPEEESQETKIEEQDNSTPFNNFSHKNVSLIETAGSLSPGSPKVRSSPAASQNSRQLPLSPGDNSDVPLSPSTWENTCLWPFPHHRLAPPSKSSKWRSTLRESDMLQETSLVEELPPLICEQLPWLPDTIDLHHRYAKALLFQIQALSGDFDRLTVRVADEPLPKGTIARLRMRLLLFLRHPKACFSAEALLSQLPYDACFEERAVVLARLGRHKQALTLWVHLLNSWEEALAHCAKVQAKTIPLDDKRRCVSEKQSLHSNSSASSDVSPDIYTMLVEVCLSPLEPMALGIKPPSQTDGETGHKDGESYKKTGSMDFRFNPRLDLAMQVMQSFNEHINVPKVLRMLPELLDLKDLSTFLESAIKQQESLLARLVFFLGAARRESVQSRQACNAATSGQIFKVTPLTRCRQCRRRIGTSAFVRYPDSGELVHYGCCRDLPDSSGRAGGGGSIRPGDSGNP